MDRHMPEETVLARPEAAVLAIRAQIAIRVLRARSAIVAIAVAQVAALVAAEVLRLVHGPRGDRAPRVACALAPRDGEVRVLAATASNDAQLESVELKKRISSVDEPELGSSTL
eukprot:4821746-Prymnesium_polylepis.2